MMRSETANRMEMIALPIAVGLWRERWVRRDSIKRYRLFVQMFKRLNQKRSAIALASDNIADKLKNNDRRVVFVHVLF